MYCKTRLVYPADLRYLIERDERRREEHFEGRTEATAAERRLFDLPRESAEGRKYTAWPGEDTEGAFSSKKGSSDRPNEIVETFAEEKPSDRVEEDAEGVSSAREGFSNRTREGAEGTFFSNKSFSDRPREIAGTFAEEEPSDRPREGTEGTSSTRKGGSARAGENAGANSRARVEVAAEAAAQRDAFQRTRERAREERTSGKGLFDRKRERAMAGTTGRWSLFDRAREETKIARPGFVEKAEASNRARAAEENNRSNRRQASEEAERSNRRRDSAEDQLSRRRGSEEAERSNRRRDSAEDQLSRRRTSEEAERSNRRRDSAEDQSSRCRASEEAECSNRRRDSAEDQLSRRRTSEEAERSNRRRDFGEDQPSRRRVFEEDDRSNRRRASGLADQRNHRRIAEETDRSERRRTIEKANSARKQLRSSGNPVVRLPEQRSGDGIVRPVVRLPEKKGAHTKAGTLKKEARSRRVEPWKRAGAETLKKARSLTRSAGEAFKRVGSALEKRVRRGTCLNERMEPSQKPARGVVAKRENGMRESKASLRFPNMQGRRQPPRRVPPRGVRNARANARMRQGQETFLERHLRSLIAMVLLAVTVIVFCVWCTSTAAGKRTFAQLGIGSASGYILLGDDCMESGNYARAVEHYYRALSRHTTYESAIKLARAYQMTGDTEREASVLLLCADQFETEREPYDRLKALYPNLTERPETVQNALNRGAHVLGDASIAQ